MWGFRSNDELGEAVKPPTPPPPTPPPPPRWCHVSLRRGCSFTTCCLFRFDHGYFAPNLPFFIHVVVQIEWWVALVVDPDVDDEASQRFRQVCTGFLASSDSSGIDKLDDLDSRTFVIFDSTGILIAYWHWYWPVSGFCRGCKRK